MKVLVPVEDPLFAACIIDFIKQHRWPKGSEFLVVHVIEPTLLEHCSYPTLAPLLEVCDERIIAQATTLVNAVAQAINNAHPDATVAQEVVEAHVNDQIHRLAEKWNADLIVIGSHGRRGFNHFVLGSVSLALASEMTTPIVLVRPSPAILKLWDSLDFPTLASQSIDQALIKLETEHRRQRILIALDETDTSEELVQFCSAHNWGANAQFKLISAVERMTHLLLSDVNMKRIEEDIRNERSKKIEELACVLRQELANNTVTTMVEKGDPRRVIIQEAKSWKADLIVIGCHFRSSFGRFLLGSVSLSTICSAPCSVLLVKKVLSNQIRNCDSQELVESAPQG